MPEGAAVIPVFNLYGESSQWPTPDLLHCETIAHRSRQHNWEIKPHRHHSVTQLLHLATGRAQAQLDSVEIDLPAPCLVLVPALCVHAFSFSDDVGGHVITLAAPLSRQLQASGEQLLALLQSAAVYPLAAGHVSEVNLLERIAAEYQQQEPGRDLMLQSLISVLLLAIARQRVVLGQAPGRRRDRNTVWFEHFTRLVEARFREHRPLPEYAADLGITTAHLNTVCRKAALQSALQVIHERLLLEARRALVYTVMTVAELADQLGFVDPAYFTRFFTQRTGVPPRQFRLQQAIANTAP